MSRLQEHLVADLTKRVRRVGLLIWDDPDRVFASAIDRVVPPGVPVVVYDGSWFELRRRVEAYMSMSSRPNLIVYVPARPPAQDPLEEIRQAGKPWSLKLKELLTTALAGELTAARIDQLAKQSKSMADAEAVLESGTGVDARLVTAFRTADVGAIAMEILTSGRSEALDNYDTRTICAEVLGNHFGAQLSPTTAEDLRASLFRGISVNILRSAIETLPAAWVGLASVEPSASQLTRCRQALDQLRDPRRLDTHRELGDALDRRLGVADNIEWRPGLIECDVTPAIEEVAVAEALRLLDTGDQVGAERIATSRLALSRWAHLPTWQGATAAGPEHPYRRWHALQRIAALQRLVVETRPPESRDAASLLAWYASDGWRVDQAQRLVELARVDLGHLAALDQHVTSARRDYEHWLDEVVTLTTAAVASGGLESVKLTRQSGVFDELVADSTSKTAYVLVDALRLELGHALASRLGLPSGPDSPPTCRAAIAAPPTITPVGMANVLPGAAQGLVLTSDGSNIRATVGGVTIRGVPDRVALLSRAVGDVLDLDFTDLVGRSDARLTVDIAKVDLVLVRSTDIDAAGESGRMGTAWRAVDGVLDDLVGQILRLGRLGIRRVVITADHGFIAMSEQLTSGRVLERPSAGGELHRRCWIGTGGLTPDGAVRIPLADLGVGGGLDVVVPNGLAVFPSSGSRQFFHGGLAPQELLVPVIEAVLARPDTTSAGKSKVAIAIAGKGITTGVFAATLTFSGDLFTSEVSVRVVARTGDGTQQVARLVAGDGFDSGTGTVTVSADPAVLTFQITSSLKKAAVVELHVLDARTGVELVVPPTKITVAAPVTVDEDWL